MPREYESTHPWITFHHQTRQSKLDLKLGEAFSKCQQLAGTPLRPATADALASLYLAKGVHATTAIEGNTLGPDDVAAIISRAKTLPESQRYLAREIDNVTAVLSGIAQAAVVDSAPFRVTPDWLKAQNAAILQGLEVEDHVVPGEYTAARLVVGRYRGAPPADVPYLVERLCDWLNGFLAIVGDPARPDDDRFVHAFLAAVLGHLYIAWIHPFGDGNGRVARALECAVLANSGIVPWIAAGLLSNHYNATRSLYYHRLDQASRLPEGVAEFVLYAAEGFVDHLRDQLAQVQSMQRRIAWESFVHESFRSQTQGEASRRRRALVLALPDDVPVPPSRMRRLTPELAESYAGKTQKTVSHDVNRLKRLGLIVGPADGGYRANTALMSAFLPPAHKVAAQP